MAADENIDIVADLLRIPFSRRSFQDKKEISERERPRPKLEGHMQAGKGFVRHFTEANYDCYS